MKETPKQTPKTEAVKEPTPKTETQPKATGTQPKAKVEPKQAKQNPPKKPPTEDSMSSSQDKASSPKAKASPPKATPSPKEKKGGSGFALVVAIVALLLALAVAAGGGWMYQQSMELRQVLASQSSELASKLNSSSKNVGQQEKQIGAVLKELKAQKQAQDSANSQMQNAVAVVSEQVSEFDKRLQAISKTDRSDWALAEAEFLLRLANERVFTGGNLANAKSLLKSAEAILASVDEMGLMPIRQALANDMIVLNEAAETDRIGLYMKLEALSGLVAKLNVLDVDAPDEGDKVDVIEAIDGDAPIEKQLEQGFDAALEKLNGYIRIENRSVPVQAVPTPAESVLVKHNLRILLNQAQLGVMSSDQALYEASLQKAQSEAERYLSMKDINTRIFLDTVKEYKGVELVGQLPDISRSRQMLKNYLDKRHFLPESAKNSVTGDVSSVQKKAVQQKTAQQQAVSAKVVKPIEAKKDIKANAASLKLAPFNDSANTSATAQGE